MTAEQRLKYEVLLSVMEYYSDCRETTETLKGLYLDQENIDEDYDKICELDLQWDSLSEIREGQVETNIPCRGSRHYESNSVGMQTSDGSWVGWTYWYGGGKHGEPDAIDWMEDAYFLDVVEEEKVVVVREFTKAK